MKDEIKRRISDNFVRVENLINLYDNTAGDGRGRRSTEQVDILRAATVLLHATLEDFLRSIADWKLPLANKNALDNIPLTGSGSNPKKFFLGELAQF